ncbi:MAG: hypothetical protein IPJ88_10960 [Myxococcales bacterium]|nr:MAG: hypothetical protein IPJ88_10960 [Myxococcales bacterium]
MKSLHSILGLLVLSACTAVSPEKEDENVDGQLLAQAIGPLTQDTPIPEGFSCQQSIELRDSLGIILRGVRSTSYQNQDNDLVVIWFEFDDAQSETEGLLPSIQIRSSATPGMLWQDVLSPELAFWQEQEGRPLYYTIYYELNHDEDGFMQLFCKHARKLDGMLSLRCLGALCSNSTCS